MLENDEYLNNNWAYIFPCINLHKLIIYMLDNNNK